LKEASEPTEDSDTDAMHFEGEPYADAMNLEEVGIGADIVSHIFYWHACISLLASCAGGRREGHVGIEGQQLLL